MVRLLPTLNRKQRRAARHASRKAGVEISPATLPPNTEMKSRPKQSPLQNRIHKMWRPASAVVTVILAIPTLLGFYVLRPDVLIEPYSSTDPARPFAQQFSIQNTSVYAIHDVVPMCGFDEDSNFPYSNLSIVRTDEQVEVLEPGSKTNLSCSVGTGPIQNELNIVPWVKYTIPFGIRRCKAAKFRGKPGAGGVYIWTYHGSDSCVSN
jgi:hypothetical protein